MTGGDRARYGENLSEALSRLRCCQPDCWSGEAARAALRLRSVLERAQEPDELSEETLELFEERFAATICAWLHAEMNAEGEGQGLGAWGRAVWNDIVCEARAGLRSERLLYTDGPLLTFFLINGLQVNEEFHQAVRVMDTLRTTRWSRHASIRRLLASVLLFVGMPALRAMERWDVVIDLAREFGPFPPDTSFLSDVEASFTEALETMPFVGGGQDDQVVLWALRAKLLAGSLLAEHGFVGADELRSCLGQRGREIWAPADWDQILSALYFVILDTIRRSDNVPRALTGALDRADRQPLRDDGEDDERRLRLELAGALEALARRHERTFRSCLTAARTRLGNLPPGERSRSWGHLVSAFSGQNFDAFVDSIRGLHQGPALQLFATMLAPGGPAAPWRVRSKGRPLPALVSLRRWGSSAGTIESTKQMMRNFGGGHFVYGGPGRGVVVDPGRDFLQLLRTRSRYRLLDVSHVVVTHDHDDHMGDLERLMAACFEAWREVARSRWPSFAEVQARRPSEPVEAEGGVLLPRLTLVIGPSAEGLATQLLWSYRACADRRAAAEHGPPEPGLVSRLESCRRALKWSEVDEPPCERVGPGSLRFCPLEHPYLVRALRLAPPSWDGERELSLIDDSDQRLTLERFEDEGLAIEALPARHKVHPLRPDLFFAMGVRLRLRFDVEGGAPTERVVVFTGDTAMPPDPVEASAYVQALSRPAPDILVANLSSVSPLELLNRSRPRGGLHLGWRGIERLLRRVPARVVVVHELLWDLSRYDWRAQLGELARAVARSRPEGERPLALIGEIGLVITLPDLQVECSPLCGERQSPSRMGLIPLLKVMGQDKLFRPLAKAEPLHIKCEDCASRFEG